MTKFLSKRDYFAVFASVLLSVFMVAVVAYGDTITISSGGVGSGTSTPGAAVAARGSGVFDGHVSANYFTSTSSKVSWIMGKLGIGTTTPGSDLNDDGGLAVAGGALIGDYVHASYFNATSTTATSTIRYGLQVATTSLFVDGNSGAVTIGTSTVPDSDVVAETMSIGPSFTVSGVGEAYGATGTVYIAGGGTTGGQIILKSSDGFECVSLVAVSGDVVPGASATTLAGLITAKVVACPK